MNQSQNDCFYLLVSSSNGGAFYVVKIDRRGKIEVVDSTINAVETEQEIGMEDANVITAVINERDTFLLAKGRVLLKKDFMKFLKGTNDEFPFQNKFNAFYKAKLKQKEEAEKLRKYKQDCNTRRLYLMVNGKRGVAEFTPIIRCEDPHLFKDAPAKVTLIDDNPENIEKLTNGVKPTQNISLARENDDNVLQNTAGDTLSFKDVVELYNLDANQQKINDIYTNYMLRRNEDDMNKKPRFVLKISPFKNFDVYLLDKKRQEAEKEAKVGKIIEKENLQHKKGLSQIKLHPFKKKQLAIKTKIGGSVKNEIKQMLKQKSTASMSNIDKEQIIKIKDKRLKRSFSMAYVEPDHNSTIMVSRNKYPKNVIKNMNTSIMLPQQVENVKKTYKKSSNHFKDKLFVKNYEKDLLEKIKFGLRNNKNVMDKYKKNKEQLPNVGGNQ